MTRKDNRHELGEGFSEILEVDRVLDEIGRGDRSDNADDRILFLLAAARAETNTAIPAAPQLADLLGEEFAPQPDTSAEEDELSLRRGRHRVRRRRVAAATMTLGGVSISGALLAGAAAATIAVGGLGYAAYSNFSQPKQEEMTTASGLVTTSSQAPTSRKSATTTSSEPKEKAPEGEQHTPEPVAPETVAAEPQVTSMTQAPSTAQNDLLHGLQNPSWTEMPEYSRLQETLADPFATKTTKPKEPAEVTTTPKLSGPQSKQEPTVPSQPIQPDFYLKDLFQQG